MQTDNTITRLAAILLLCGFLAACGQKGDLYLPDNNVQYVSAG